MSATEWVCLKKTKKERMKEGLEGERKRKKEEISNRIWVKYEVQGKPGIHENLISEKFLKN